MFKINEDLSIYVTRGDMVFLKVTAENNEEPYTFQAGEVLRIKVYGKKNCENVVLQKDFPVTTTTQEVEIILEEKDTKIGGVISKPTDYWYEVELNPFDNPQTIIGYDDDGTKVFKLFPEGDDIDEYEPIAPEDIPIVDEELDLTSARPVQNQVIARAFANLQEGYKATQEAVSQMYVTPKMFGAVGDGEADETEFLENMLENGGNILLPEGVYTTNKPLYVNVNTTTLNGISSRSVIKAGENFPDNEAVITFYSSGDYYTRNQRENTHGNFAVIGRDKKCVGVRIGGAVGSKYEGNVECSIFRSIFVDKCDVAYLWGAHAYRNTLIECDSHSNNYCLKTADDITDVGEVFTCINCGFWSGALHLANCGEIMMYACTIHTKTGQIVDGVEVGHYFKDTFVSFQNCHFEAILQSTEDKEKVYAPQFCAKNSLVYLSECTGVISSTTNMALDTYLFKDESDNGRPHGIFVNGGLWKYYFGRIRPKKALCSGNCELKDITLKYMFDGVSIPYHIYEDTKAFAIAGNLGYDYTYGFGGVKPTVTLKATSDTEKTYIVAFSDVSSSAIGIYRKIDITGFKTCVINGSIQHLANTTDKSTLASNSDSPSIIMFLDKEGNYLDWSEPNNATLYTDGNTLTVAGRFIAIPMRAKYALVGFDIRRGGGFWNTESGETPLSIKSSLTFEFI